MEKPVPPGSTYDNQLIEEVYKFQLGNLPHPPDTSGRGRLGPATMHALFPNKAPNVCKMKKKGECGWDPNYKPEPGAGQQGSNQGNTQPSRSVASSQFSKDSDAGAGQGSEGTDGTNSGSALVDRALQADKSAPDELKPDANPDRTLHEKK